MCERVIVGGGGVAGPPGEPGPHNVLLLLLLLLPGFPAYFVFLEVFQGFPYIKQWFASFFIVKVRTLNRKTKFRVRETMFF